MVAHALQQQTRIVFVFTVEPERAVKVQHEQTKPLDKRLVLDASEQPTHGGSVADHSRLNALGEPWTAHSLTPPMPPLDAVFAGYVSRFVVVR